jgi:hypothetical protein
LITIDPELPVPVVRVHALVQRATLEALSTEQLSSLAQVAADALLGAWPGLEPGATVGQMFRANAEMLTNTAGAHLWTSGCHPVLFRVGISLAHSGLRAEVRDHYERLHAMATNQLGPDHVDTLAAYSNLAFRRGDAGDPAGAAHTYKDLLARRIHALGPDHPETLLTRNNLALWRGKAGDAAKAAAMFEELLADDMRILGADHPATFNTRRNLAWWRDVAGDRAGADAMRDLLHTDELRVFGFSLARAYQHRW